jgi:hypothetical protein
MTIRSGNAEELSPIAAANIGMASTTALTAGPMIHDAKRSLLVSFAA